MGYNAIDPCVIDILACKIKGFEASCDVIGLFRLL